MNGDYNPLHGTPEPGKAIGHGGIILHGVYAYNCVAHDLLRKLGQSDPSRMKEFQAKFVGVVKPGDTLQTSFWRVGAAKDGWEEILFVTKVVSSGYKVCLSEGKAVIRTGSARSGSKL